MNKEKIALILLLTVIVGFLGYKFAASDAESLPGAPENRIEVKTGKQNDYIYPLKFDDDKKKEPSEYELENIPLKERTLRGDKMLHFDSEAEMEEFLKRARMKGLIIVKKLHGLKMVRVRFTKNTQQSDFLARFGEVTLVSDNSTVSIPEPLLEIGAVGFRGHPLDFLGVKDNSTWGKGITVAVIDTGVVSHSALKGNITHIDLINDGSPISSYHGTGVASLIAADSELIKGVSPGVSLLDIRALNNDGSGDAFTIAEAIMKATDAGARVINLSLGANYDNAALRQAVLYAQRNGSILVAAVGNDGIGRVSFPASYPGVIGVGSNDANENYLSFSNRGPQVDLTAPGIELTAAGLNDGIFLFTGTSASSPIVAATVASQLAQHPDWTNEQIFSHLENNANESGLPGIDNLFGNGSLNIGRMQLNYAQANVDTAAAGFHLEPVPGTNNLRLYLTGENRGTETVSRVEMKVEYPGYERTFYFNDVASSQAFYETLTISSHSELVTKEQKILLTVKQVHGESNLSNNAKTVRIRLNQQ